MLGFECLNKMEMEMDNSVCICSIQTIVSFIHFDWVFRAINVYCVRACLFMCVRECVEIVNLQITNESKVILIAIYCVCYLGTNKFAFVYVHVNTRLIDVRLAAKKENNIIITIPINVHIKMLSIFFFSYTKWLESKLLFRIHESNSVDRNSIFALIAKFNKVTHLISFNASFCSSFPLYVGECVHVWLRLCGIYVCIMCIFLLALNRL